MNPWRVQHVAATTVVKVLTLVVPFLSAPDRAQCALVNRRMYAAVCRFQWHHPRFDDGHIHDSLYLFDRFIRLLPSLSQETRRHITEIDLCNVEESLYDRVPPHFFQFLAEWCPQLTILAMAHCTFFVPGSLRHLPPGWSFPRLQALDLSFCDQLTDAMLVTLAAGLPQLRRLKLDSTHAGHAGVAALADRCDRLESISMVDTCIGDDCLAALAKFRTIHLKEMDLGRCAKITPHGLEAMTKYNVHLRYLGLSHTPIQSAPLAQLLLRNSSVSAIRYLDITGCGQLATAELAHALIQSKLVQLVASFPVALACTKVQHAQPIPSLFQNTTITSMVIHDLPEGTPIQFLSDLLGLVPHLNLLTITRDYYEDDFIYGTYTQPTNAPATINDATLDAFQRHHASTFISLVNKREAVPGVGMRFW